MYLLMNTLVLSCLNEFDIILPELELQSKSLLGSCTSHVKVIPGYVPNIKEKLQ